MLTLALALAAPVRAQAVDAVPPGVEAVTVMVCAEPEGCAAGWQAMADHCAGLGVPLLDFEAVAAAGPGGGDARAEVVAALEGALLHPRRSALEAARAAVQAAPLTLANDDVFRLWLTLGGARLDEGDAVAAEEAFQAAASSTAGRVHDLPPLSPEALDRYLAVAAQARAPTRLRIDADNPAALAYVDGLLVGAVPVEVEVLPGWHRVSVERPGRDTAWVGEVTAVAGRPLDVRAEVADDDAAAVLEAAVAAGIAGAATPPEVSRQLAAWARGHGLSTVRFVTVGPPQAAGKVPEERLQHRGGTLDVHALWLDVGAARMSRRGPGPVALRTMADPERFTLGVQLGYARLQSSLPTGPDPHDHLSVQLVGRVLLTRDLFLDARLGLWRAAQPWYLYDDWLSTELVPAALGLRWAPGPSGVYLGAQGLVVVPLAVGGQGLLGWEWQPTNRWRLGVEGHGGYTDQGAVFGGGLSASFAG